MPRAFVFGNGPSLKNMDLGRFIGEITFACNRIDLLYDKDEAHGIRGTAWRPTFYVYMEMKPAAHPYREKNKHNISKPEYNPFYQYVIPKHVFPRVEQCIISDRFESTYRTILLQKREWRGRIFDNVQFVHTTCRHAGTDIQTEDRRPMDWHLPNLCIYSGTLYPTIQLAFMMGYEPIYLVGCDLGFKPIGADTREDPNHFHPGYWTWDDHLLKDRDATLIDMHSICKQEFERMGKHIYNATVGGELEVYERVRLEDVL